MIAQYKIITGDKLTVEIELRGLIANGWEPVGGASVAYDDRHDRQIFAQAVGLDAATARINQLAGRS